ncbi:MAG: NAD(P)H-dependent oxidoreductase [bacterium]|nr:NAD(P)H-dependent oxidoreductase [bacterium]
MKKVLIINAHQYYEGFAEGKLNKTMIDVMEEVFKVKGYETKLTDIEKGYDPIEEVEKHVWADFIITQSPIYWFGLPWIYKKYVDEVFNTGLFQQVLLVDDGRTREDPDKQYGTGGKMQGKQHMLSLTWNAPEEAFGDKGQYLFEGKTADDVVIATTAVYKFSGAEILPSFSCYDVIKNPDVEGDIGRLKALLEKIAS